MQQQNLLTFFQTPPRRVELVVGLGRRLLQELELVDEVPSIFGPRREALRRQRQDAARRVEARARQVREARRADVVQFKILHFNAQLHLVLADHVRFRDR